MSRTFPLDFRDLPAEIVAVLAPFAPVFAEQTWTKAQLFAVGTLLTIGRRTVASALQIMGRGKERDFTNYHRLLSRDARSSFQAGRILLGLILAILPQDVPLVLAVNGFV